MERGCCYCGHFGAERVDLGLWEAVELFLSQWGGEKDSDIGTPPLRLRYLTPLFEQDLEHPSSFKLYESTNLRYLMPGILVFKSWENWVGTVMYLFTVAIWLIFPHPTPTKIQAWPRVTRRVRSSRIT